MDHKQSDMKWLATELESKSHKEVGDEKLIELIEVFNGIVANSERPFLDSIDELPGWFLLEALGCIWLDVLGKDFVLHQLHSKFEKDNHRELKIQIAATISTTDPQSGISMLARMDDKNLRKKGKLPKPYVESLLKYFAENDFRPLHAILERHGFENQRHLESASLQFFQALFAGKPSLALARKYELQSKLLHWLIANKQYVACTKMFPDVVVKEVRQWPLAMLEEYGSIQKAADSAEIPFNALMIPISKVPAKEEDMDLHKGKLRQKLSDAELLEELGKRLSQHTEHISIVKSKLEDQSAQISDLLKQKANNSQRVDALEDEKKKLIVKNETVERQHTEKVHALEEEIQKYKKVVEEKENSISILNMEIVSAKNEHSTRIDEITKRIVVESDHSKNLLAEKIQDSLLQNFNDMNQLDSENHRIAKIMLGDVFDKLHGLGITFNK